MKRNKLKFSVLIASFLIICFTLIFLVGKESKSEFKSVSSKPRNSKNNTSSQNNVEKESMFLRIFQKRIDVFGIVVDQKKKPVSGANVSLFALASASQDRSKPVANLVTNVNGEFSATDLQGAQISVIASKEGFVSYSPLGGPESSTVLLRSTSKKSPVILTLHDPGDVPPIFHVERQRVQLESDGIPASFSLSLPNYAGKEHVVEFTFKSGWKDLPQTYEGLTHGFDWSLDVRVPGGGLLKDKNEVKNGGFYVMEAPQDGYQPFVSYVFRISEATTNWTKYISDSFFVRFADNTYGKIRFSIDADSIRKPMILETWYNKQANSRVIPAFE